MAVEREVRVVDDVGVAFAELVAQRFHSKPNDMFSLALSGGSTATACYRSLATADIQWNKIGVLWGDERQVPLDHPDSNYLLAQNALGSRLTEAKTVLPMAGTAADYESQLDALWPIDVVHLGMGDDGHTASLFPGSSALDTDDRMVVETGDDLHPHRRLSLTFAALARAELAVFTVTGQAKANMLARVLRGEELPAGKVRSRQQIWLVDEQAASEI